MPAPFFPDLLLCDKVWTLLDMKNLNDSTSVLSQWGEFGYEWVKSRKFNYFPVSPGVCTEVGKSTEKQILRGAGTHAWHPRLKADTADRGHGCSSEGMTSPRSWARHSVNTDLRLAEVMPTPPYSATLLHPAYTYPECMAWRLSRVGQLGAVSQLRKYKLTTKEALASFFPIGTA